MSDGGETLAYFKGFDRRQKLRVSSAERIGRCRGRDDPSDLKKVSRVILWLCT